MFTIQKASDLTGYEVVNSQDEFLGIIKEIMIDIEMGKISYAVLSFKSDHTGEEKLFALPWSSLTLNTAKKHFILNVSIADLHINKGFDPNNWPQFANAKWLESSS